MSQAQSGGSRRQGAAGAAPQAASPLAAAAPPPLDWARILKALRMDDRQLHYLKMLRDRHQEKLRALVSARQALSLEVRRARQGAGLR